MGNPLDKAMAEMDLVLGEMYELESLACSPMYTRLKIKGFDHPFNSVQFEVMPTDKLEYEKMCKESFEELYETKEHINGIKRDIRSNKS